MPTAPTLSLLVIRVADLDLSVSFYAVLGFTFTQEQHGKGPVHYSTLIGETVFELYSANEKFPATAVRMGFVVDSVEAILTQWQQSGHTVTAQLQQSLSGVHAVVADPDGHRIELSEKSTDTP